MVEEKERAHVREAVALFKSVEDLRAAIDELERSGFDHADVSVLGTEQTLRRTFGGSFRTTAELEDVGNTPRLAEVSPQSMGLIEGLIIGGLTYVGAVSALDLVIAGGGGLAITIAAAVLTGGATGAIGVGLARHFHEADARHMEEHVASGGLLLWSGPGPS